jgi:hypothetical protein
MELCGRKYDSAPRSNFFVEFYNMAFDYLEKLMSLGIHQLNGFARAFSRLLKDTYPHPSEAVGANFAALKLELKYSSKAKDLKKLSTARDKPSTPLDGSKYASAAIVQELMASPNFHHDVTRLTTRSWTQEEFDTVKTFWDEADENQYFDFR